MGVYEARGQLGKAIKDLRLRWNEAQMNWDDAVARRFEERFLAPIESDLKNSLAAMDHMVGVLNQIQRDCE